MKRTSLITILSSVLFLSACHVQLGDSDDKKDAGGATVNTRAAHRVDWASIPSEFNPSIDEHTFSTTGVEKIYMDSELNQDIETVYSDTVLVNTVKIKIYKVWKKSASWFSIIGDASSNKLNIRASNGSNSCHIKKSNGRITELEGGCYERVQVILPLATQIEVYSINELISPRFFPMTNEELVEFVNNASFANDKYAVIDAYLKSYSDTAKTPDLHCEQLGEVINDFSFTKDKFKVLSLLHATVKDRAYMKVMIQQRFNTFDQPEAFRIAGI